ncbi:hypothetical protein DV515_00012030, partial [Chloebia gouldiae]
MPAPRFPLMATPCPLRPPSLLGSAAGPALPQRLVLRHIFSPGSVRVRVQSLALTVPVAVLAVYYLLLQTYSLRLEAFLSAILLLFYGLELLLGFLALLSFSRCHMPETGGAGVGAA